MNWRERMLTTVLRGVDALAALLPLRAWTPRRNRSCERPGVSILIPERGTPELLIACLASVDVASALLEEPREVLVVVNGAPPAAYDQVKAAHPSVRWHFEAESLGFNGAIAVGLQQVAYDWVYLLNSDMTLDPKALVSVLGHRDARTFAIASQIYFADPNRRREETGWTDFWVQDGVTQHYDRVPEDSSVRGHLYASGGASLFQASLLRTYARSTRAYAPFYFEDADWSVQAARDGFVVKFCPQSSVSHVHRATVKKFYSPGEIARIARRNQLFFEARHGFGGATRLLAGESAATRRELTRARSILGIARERWKTRRARRRGYEPEHAWMSQFPLPLQANRPTEVLVAAAEPSTAPTLAARELLVKAEEITRRSNLILVVEAGRERDDDTCAIAARCSAVHIVRAYRDVASARAASDAHADLPRQTAWWRAVYECVAIPDAPAESRSATSLPHSTRPLRSLEKIDPIDM
jgi:GT2 family glycosyltransferase